MSNNGKQLIRLLLEVCRDVLAAKQKHWGETGNTCGDPACVVAGNDVFQLCGVLEGRRALHIRSEERRVGKV